MATLEAGLTISDAVTRAVPTGVMNERALASTVGPGQSGWEAWQKLINRLLVEWESGPSHFDDDGLEPPTTEAMCQACLLAREMRDKGYAVPERVVPDGEGGMAFSLTAGPNYWSIEIDANGAVEVCCFKDCRLVSRQRLR